MKKTMYILFIALFFVLCLVPSAGMLMAGPSPAAANEAPAAAPRLTLADGSLNSSVLTELGDYIGRGFFLRLEGITGWDAVCAGVFRTSGNDDVLIGPNGWLFYGAAVNDITGADQMTDREIWCAARSLRLMQEYAEARGAAFLFVVPCGKYTVYPEEAPALVTVAADSNRERLMAAMDAQSVAYADLYPAFAAHRERPLYWKWDSHWNGLGAALGADVILEALGREGGFFDGPFTLENGHVGDLYEMLYPRGTAREDDYRWAGDISFDYTSDFHTYDDMTITTVCGAGEGSLLLFRDSSGRSMYPYLARRFAEAYISRANSYPLYLVEERGADTVVVELAERTLPYLLRYPAAYPAPAREMSVLNGMTPVESDISAGAGAGPEGYQKLTGNLPAAAADSPVYLAAEGRVYEAIPNAGSFTAWLPSEIDPAGVTAYIFPA